MEFVIIFLFNSGKDGPYDVFKLSFWFLFVQPTLFCFSFLDVSNNSSKLRLANIPCGGKRLKGVVFETFSDVFNFGDDHLIEGVFFSLELVGMLSFFGEF